MTTTALPPAAPTAPPPPSSRLAWLSLIAGILGWTLLPGLGSIVAIVAGHAARTRIAASNDAIGGRRLAVAGTFLGYSFLIALATLAMSVILGILLFVGSATRRDPEVDVVQRALEELPESATVEARVITMIAEQIGYDEEDVTLDSDLDDLGLDDEDRLDLAESIRDEFQVAIDDDAIDRSTTVADLIRAIDRRRTAPGPRLHPHHPNRNAAKPPG